MCSNSFARACVLFLLSLPLYLLHSAGAQAAYRDLHAVYRQLIPVLEHNDFGMPVYINSRDEQNTMQGVIYGIVPYAFTTLGRALLTPVNWCAIAPQHPNIKACTYRPAGGYCQLTFYTGRKFYENPEDVHQIDYRFRLVERHKDYFHISLTAEDGPAGTSDYHVKVQAIPLDAHRSFVYFSYAYHYNFITRMGMGSYLATLGSGKVGFSVTGRDEQGRPVYIQGVRGIIERNAVRYYLAIQSYLDTLHVPLQQRLIARLKYWFDLTERHARQLHEMSKQDYLHDKQREWRDQLRLQQLIKPAAQDHACQPTGLPE